MLLVLVEIFFQAVYAYRDELKGTPLEMVTRHIEPPFSWERYFFENYKDGNEGILNMRQQGLHLPHTSRGWSLRPNISKVINGDTYTTNSDGFRSLDDFIVDPNRFAVLIVGDSYSFGDEAGDSEIWPYLLQSEDERLNIFNLGGSGYGVDQMYITLSESIELYKPNLVIAAFVDDDLRRSMLDFRDYKKPRFILRGSELKVTNTPIGGIDEVISEIEQRGMDNYSRIQIINVINSIRGGLISRKGVKRWTVCESDCMTINKALFEKMEALAKLNGADFMMLYLPRGNELVDPLYMKSDGEHFFNIQKTYRGHFFLNPRRELLKADFVKSKGHYRIGENRLVGRLVYEKILEIPSWADFNSAQR